MDVLLVNPNNRVVSPFAGLEPPVWAGMYATQLRDLGMDVAILDAEVLDLTIEQTCSYIWAKQPKEIVLVAMGSNPSVASTAKMPIIKKIVDNLRGKFNLKVTGLHPTALPKDTEAELGIEVLKGKIFEGTPDIAFDLMPMNLYQSHFWHCLDGSKRTPYAATYTRLNCGSRCAFCNVAAQYGFQNKVWFRDSNAFIKEIDLLVNKYRVHAIKFWDEHFTGNHLRVNEICDRLIERNYDLNIWAYARVDSINPRILAKMRKAGIKWLAVGFESGNDDVLSNVNKRATSNQSVEAVKMMHDADINIMGNFMFGFDGESLESMRKTHEFAKSLNIEFVNYYVYKPYPGSKLFNPATDSYHWGKYGQYSGEKSEAMKFQNWAFGDYFTDPNYQSHIKQRFGGQAVDKIIEMVSFGKPIARC